MSTYDNIEPGFYIVRVLYYMRDGSITVDYHDRYFRGEQDAREEVIEIRADIKRSGGCKDMISWKRKQREGDI